MKKLLLVLLFVSLSVSCSKGDKNFLDLKEYSFDKTNSQLMFQDDEEVSVMTSAEENEENPGVKIENRTYEIGKVLRVRAIDEFTIEVANFAPINIENAIITANIEGINSQIQLFKINKINAHSIQEIKYSFIDESTDFKTVDNAIVGFSIRTLFN